MPPSSASACRFRAQLTRHFVAGSVQRRQAFRRQKESTPGLVGAVPRCSELLMMWCGMLACVLYAGRAALSTPDQTTLIYSRGYESLSGQAHSTLYSVDIQSGEVKRLATDQNVIAWR